MVVGALGLGFFPGCRTPPAQTAAPAPAPLAGAARLGDEIMVAGQWFHTGTRVLTWQDAGGYDGYRDPRPVPAPNLARLAPPYTARALAVPPKDKGPPNVATLQQNIDQFVLHYDGCGLSEICFAVLQRRGLSVHFLLDVDGTVYQTLDLQERAWHATTSNDRGIGIEIANIGAYAPGDTKVFSEWYERTIAGQVRLKYPATAGATKIHTPNFTGRPLRPDAVRGVVQGKALEQYDLTPGQYAALIKLTAALCRVFPLINCDCPRDAAGQPLRQKLPDAVLAKYRGLLGHYHIQENKIDPGPALQWDLLVKGARRLNPEAASPK